MELEKIPKFSPQITLNEKSQQSLYTIPTETDEPCKKLKEIYKPLPEVRKRSKVSQSLNFKKMSDFKVNPRINFDIKIKEEENSQSREDNVLIYDS